MMPTFQILRSLQRSAVLCAALLSVYPCFASDGGPGAKKTPPKPAAPRDTLVFENGDTLHGQLDREVAGTVYFNSDELGAISVPWSKVKTLQTQNQYVVLTNDPGVHVRHVKDNVARGSLAVQNGQVSVANKAAAAGNITTRSPSVSSTLQPIPVAKADFILDTQTFDKQVRHNPGFLQGWNGAATLGITLVQATQNQYTYNSSVALVRTVPTVTWLETRNRTTADFSSSYGLITQPAYVSAGVLIPATNTKSSIFHADAERDQYLSNRFYALAQTAFDHNYSLGLDLQQIYGAGFGVTAIKRPHQTLDLKATLQYERQTFNTPTSGTSQDIIGSTLAATYNLILPKGMVFNQQASYLPAFNTVRDYSAGETDTFTVPFYKNIAFTLGTIDTYLNDPPPAEPPTKRNSFQFTTGITYTLKSKY